MRFDLRSPCSSCPFRYDIEFTLAPGRVHEIWEGITDDDGTFACHKTVEFYDDGEHNPSFAKEQHCAGALIVLMQMEQPNQMMRIAMRIGAFDPDKLDMDAPVFDDVDVMAEVRGRAYRGRDARVRVPE